MKSLKYRKTLECQRAHRKRAMNDGTLVSWYHSGKEHRCYCAEISLVNHFSRLGESTFNLFAFPSSLLLLH